MLMRVARPFTPYAYDKRPQSASLMRGLLPLSLVIFAAGGIGPNTFLAIAALLALMVGSTLLWRPGESPILLFSFWYPWFQATISIFHANWVGVPVDDLTPFFGNMRDAILLSLAGLLTFAVGMRLGAGPRRWQDAWGLREQAYAMPIGRWVRLYAVAWAGGAAAITLTWIAPGLAQVLLGVAAMKWAFFFILAYAAFVGAPRARPWFTVIFLFELASGIGSYFSDFKTVFFVTIFAAVASGFRLSFKSMIGFGALGAVLLAFGIVWTAVKGEFRNFASGGEAAQIVTVDYWARIEKLGELAGDLNGDKLAFGADQFLRRLSYVQFFSAVLEYVPAQVPHAQGALAWDAVSRPFMPRMFFPEKSVIDDTSRTNYYTGGLAGDSEATSISLGWVAEMYIDFGYFGMFPAILLVGVFFGRIYRGFLRWKMSYGLLGAAIATAVLTGAGAFENSFTKTFGGIAATLLAAWAVVNFAVPRWARWRPY
jgi:hypothetical protein